MGNRTEGKTKKKSVKAKVTSKFSSKRKLSRMGKKVKKGEAGPSTEFITRSAVLKKLQITLKDFRRLCILKGIYPRVPAKAPKGADKVYYDIKDISYLSHEPLLAKFREFKSFMKKIRKAAGRNQFVEARRKDRMKPTIVLDHLVKERYPRFIDALRDLDDPLCMIHLFAAMPSVGRITTERTTKCNELVRHWQFYIAMSKSLNKVFVSVKGVYFQAEIMGELVTWLVPHKFTQSIPKEVDIRVMMTFLDFYEVLMKFILFKLYHMQGLRYPPIIDKELNDVGCCLLAVKTKPLEPLADDRIATTDNLESDTNQIEKNKIEFSNSSASINDEKLIALNKKIATLVDIDEDEDDDEVSIAGPLGDAFTSLRQNDDGQDDEERRTFTSHDDTNKRSKLFQNLKFFVNREVPLDWLQLCTLSFGASIGWDGEASPFDSSDPGITHHVVDRPMQGIQNQTREYVQPQWVLDCINAQILLPVHQYRPGCKLPPHLSPFVDDSKEGYLPKYREEIKKLQAAQDQARSALDTNTASVVEKEVLDGSGSDSDDEDSPKQTMSSNKGSVSKAVVSSHSDEESESSSEESDEEPVSTKGPKGVVHVPSQVQQSETEEHAELSRIMMSKKTKRLYGRMQHGIKQKQELVNKLEVKRNQLESNHHAVVDESTQSIDDKQNEKNQKKKKKNSLPDIEEQADAKEAIQLKKKKRN